MMSGRVAVIIISFLVIFVLAGAAYVVLLNKETPVVSETLEVGSIPIPSPEPSSTPKIIRTNRAPGGQELDEGDEQIAQDNALEIDVEDDEDDLAEEPQLFSDVANLRAVGGYSGSGTAIREFNGSALALDVTANLPPARAGKFYEGWLVQKLPELKFISTGRVSQTSGSEHIMLFIADEPYNGYDDVVITEETDVDGLDGVPETHVLEGSFFDAATVN